MHSLNNQRNSSIGPTEAPTANCAESAAKSRSNPFGGVARRVIGMVVLLVATVLAVNQRVAAPAADSVPAIQRADIIDDIIEIIEDIFDLDEDEEDEPNP